MGMFERVELTNTTEEELIKVINTNCKKAYLTREEIKKLEELSKSSNKSAVSVNKTQEEDFSKQPYKISEDSAFESIIKNYLKEISNLSVDDFAKKIKEILPEKSDYNCQKVVLRIKAEIGKNIKEIKECINSERDSLTKDDIETLEKDINDELEKILIIDNFAKEEEKKENQEENKPKNNLIFVPTSGGNIKALEEIDHIPTEYYEGFLKLFDSIKDGTFKQKKRFSIDLSNLPAIYEVKGHQIRVVYDMLADNNYAIIAAFVKKNDNAQGYRDYLINSVTNYTSQSGTLKKNLSNEEFMKLQKGYEEELYRKLCAPSEKTKKKGVN